MKVSFLIVLLPFSCLGIIGGSNVGYKYPWIASLPTGCGGIVLNSKTVLTAAHCTPRTGPVNTDAFGKVWANKPYKSILNSASLIFNVTSVKRHPDFTTYPPPNVTRYEGYYSNDVAIWKVELIQGNLQHLEGVSIKLTNKTIDGLQGQLLQVAGWGVYDQSNPLSDDYPVATELLETTVPLLSMQQCENDYPMTDFEATASICAGYVQGGPNACSGDSGGPLFSINSNQVELVGLVSWHKNKYNETFYELPTCGIAGHPEIFTDLTHPRIRNFVLENLD